MSGDISKLPKWAQTEIEVLRRNVSHLEAELAIGPDESDTFIDPYTRDRTPLGKGVRIVLELQSEQSIEVVNKGEYVEARSTGKHSGSLQIQPQSSNAVRLREGSWW